MEHSQSAATLGPADRKAALVAQDILVRRPREVAAYLDFHLDLAELLPALCGQGRQEFGPQAELTLQVYHDRESADCHLSLYVRLPCYEGPILERMGRVTQLFDDELSRASGSFLLTTDLRSPGLNHGV